MIFTKKMFENYFFETQLTIMPKQLSITFDMHYSDGQLVDHQGFYFHVLIFGLFFEFNIYEIRHANEMEE
jgi:hypothetical protein